MATVINDVLDVFWYLKKEFSKTAVTNAVIHLATLYSCSSPAVCILYLSSKFGAEHPSKDG